MVKKLPTTNTGWPVPTTVKEDFVEFVAHVGSIAQEDCAGALFLWQHVPPDIREWAKLDAKGSPAVEAVFWRDLKGLMAARKEPELREKIIAVLVEVGVLLAFPGSPLERYLYLPGEAELSEEELAVRRETWNLFLAESVAKRGTAHSKTKKGTRAKNLSKRR